MNESTVTKLDEFRLRWTVGRKIGALVGGLLLLLLVGSLNSLRRASEVGEGLREVADIDIPLLAEMREIESAQHERHIALIRGYQQQLHGAASGTNAWDTQLARFEEETRAIARTFAAAESSMALAPSLSGTTAAKYTQVDKELAALRQHTHDYETKARQFIALLTKGDTEGSAAAMLDELERTSDEIDADYHILEDDLQKFAEGRLAEAEAQEVAALNLNLIMSGAGFVVGLLLFVWLMHRLTRSISAVTQRAEAVARGELGLEPLTIDSTDELGRLSTVFNQMSETLKSQVRDTRSAIETLNSAASQIVAASKEQSATAKEQAATIQEITASMEEIGQSGTQISERAAQVSGRAEEASQTGNTGREAMRETNESMGSIRTQIEEVAENIVTLSEKTQAVGEIISAVNEIAEQSNLLALNAAIEAAAAGEQGSRFSVVAGEIKNLSDQAKDSTGQVGRILGEIQKGINTAVMLTEEAVKRAEVGKEKAASTERTISNLVVSTQESVEAFQQIVAGSNQQQIGITQTSQGMHDIRQAAEQTAIGTAQLEKAAVDLTSLGRQLHEVVDQYTL